MANETVPAPKRIYAKDERNGNTYLKYAEGDPVPMDEAKQLGIVGKKAQKEAENKAVFGDSENKADAAPPPDQDVVVTGGTGQGASLEERKPSRSKKK